MADLDSKQAAQTVKIAGSDSAGVETNFVDATANGLKVDGSAVTQPVSDAGGSLTVDDGGSSLTVDGTVTANAGTGTFTVAGTVTANAGTGTFAVSAASLPLPTGAATETTLSALNTKTPALGQALMAASQPVVIASNQSAVPVSASSLPLPTGAATETTSSSINTNLTNGTQKAIARGGAKGTTTAADVTSTNIDANTQALDVAIKASTSIAVTGPLTDAQLRATAVPVSGTVTANAGTGTFQTNITNASLAVTGPLTDTQLRASAVPVSGSVTATISGTPTVALDTASLAALESITVQNGAGVSAVNIQDGGNSITVDGTVSISGSVAVTGPLTDAQLRATAVPVSAASLPLPTGAATSALQTTGNTSLSNLDTKTPALGQALMAASRPVVIASNQSAIPVTGTFFQATQPVSAASLPLPTGAATETTVSALNTKVPSGLTVTSTRLLVDGSGVTQPVSDGGGSLTVDGTVNAGVSIGDNYAPSIPYTEVSTGKLMTDPDNQLITRGDVLTDEGTFRDDFAGAALTASWTGTTAGTGSITVGSSLVNLITGTTSGNAASIIATGDYGPISIRSQFSLSNRSANQTVKFGFTDNILTPAKQAIFQFTGTTNTVVSCITSWSTAATDVQTTTVTIPNGTSATSNDYYIEVQPDQVTFVINGIQVAQHRLHIPGPYDIISPFAYAVNTGVATTSTLSIDYIYFINQNALQITNSFTGDDLLVRLKTGTAQTYGAAITGLAAGLLPTDIFTITGSATKTVKIKHMSIDGTQTTSGVVNVQLIKRSTANTAGTSTTLTAVPFDSFNAAATATVRAYTANPTLGTTVGAVHSEKLVMGTTTALVEDKLVFESPQNENAQELTLRGTNEVLAVNLGGVTVLGNSINVDIVWTEE